MTKYILSIIAIVSVVITLCNSTYSDTAPHPLKMKCVDVNNRYDSGTLIVRCENSEVICYHNYRNYSSGASGGCIRKVSDGS
jgi:hypothetical protein